jgi:hypothetical protein
MTAGIDAAAIARTSLVLEADVGYVSAPDTLLIRFVRPIDASRCALNTAFSCLTVDS